MSLAGIICLSSSAFFVLYSSLVAIETRNGRRFFLSGLRNHLDTLLVNIVKALRDAWDHFIHYIVRLGWYYSIHSFLRTIMKLLVSVYDFLETLFESNRSKTRILRMMKRERTQNSQFDSVAEHKEDTALSPTKQKELLDQKLEELH